jgi:putative membrane protein
MRWVLLFLLLLLPVGLAHAHPGQPPAPHDLPSTWNWEPAVLLGMVLSGGLYAASLRALWERAGVGHGVSVRQAAAFAAGWLSLAAALISPLDALSGVLFSAHMLQHVLLILVAAPLLVLGAPPAALAWSVPRVWRRKFFGLGRSLAPLQAAGHLLALPLVAWGLHVLALWAWHAPGLYEAALSDERLHALEHLSFLGTALLFWWGLLQPMGGREIGLGLRLLSIFTMALQSGFLSALLTFSPQSWYPAQSSGAAAWGLTPLDDQQFAGVLMWVPAGMVYLVTALWLLGSRLHAMEQDDLTTIQSLENET